MMINNRPVKIWTDNVEKGGWLHVVDLPAECDTGWISSRYIVYDEPQPVFCELEIRAEGRVACRQWIGGKVIHWVHNGETVMVYYSSEEWSVTDMGYIKTEYLEGVEG